MPGRGRCDQAGARQPPGLRRCGGARGGDDLLRQPQLAPFFLQGTKTLAYELWEDLGFKAPDNVIVPCGAGSNVLGCGIGFGELLRAGQIARLPRIFAAQPANCAPIARASLGAPEAAPAPTMAEGTAIAQPMRLPECLAALRESGGGAVMLSEAEIAAATLELARGGIYVEPTCAQAAAAFGHLLRRGRSAPRRRRWWC